MVNFLPPNSIMVCGGVCVVVCVWWCVCGGVCVVVWWCVRVCVRARVCVCVVCEVCGLWCVMCLGQRLAFFLLDVLSLFLSPVCEQETLLKNRFRQFGQVGPGTNRVQLLYESCKIKRAFKT